MMMRALVVLAAICFSATAFAQTPPPKASKKPPVALAAPKAPMGCKLVGTVKGTKIWAGDCVAATTAAETGPLSSPTAQPSAAVPPGEKQ
jgi:hypothetical protein